MTDLEKIQYTKSFIDKLANGINPLTDEIIPENDLLNNIRISRCMFYVSSLLQEMCLGLTSGKSKNKTKRNNKAQFYIPEEKLLSFEYSSQGMYVGDIVFKLNALIDTDYMKKIGYKQITSWLLDKEYLYVFTMDNGKTYKRPTPAGVKLGISETLRYSTNGEYYTLTYDVNAQKFVVSNCNLIGSANNNTDGNALYGQPWTTEQDEMLTTMFNDGILVVEIAQKLQRTEGAIRARLVRLGLIRDRDEAL